MSRAAPTAGPEQRFAQAQDRFEAAQARLAIGPHEDQEARRLFRLAAEEFAAIAADGTRSANLCVNAGNAYQFAGDSPRALLWYLRASRLESTPRIHAALATLRRVCRTDTWVPPRPSLGRVLLFWHYDLAERTRQILTLTLYPGGCLLVIIGLFLRRPRHWRRIGLALLAAGALLGVSDVVAALAGPQPWAVVLERTTGYAGDGPMYSTVVDAIPAGQEVRVIEARREWMQVELPSAARCWVSSDVCERVGP